jgi:hypothetical protein
VSGVSASSLRKSGALPLPQRGCCSMSSSGDPHGGRGTDGARAVRCSDECMTTASDDVHMHRIDSYTCYNESRMYVSDSISIDDMLRDISTGAGTACGAEAPRRARGSKDRLATEMQCFSLHSNCTYHSCSILSRHRICETGLSA